MTHLLTSEIYKLMGSDGELYKDFNPEPFESIRIEKLDSNQRRQKTANILMSTYRFATLPNDKIYVYQNGIFTENSENIIKQATVYSMAVDYIREDYLNVLDRIKAQTSEDSSFFEASLNLIAVDNGIINLNTLRLEEYAEKSESHFLSKLPITFDDKSRWDEDDTKDWTRWRYAHSDDEENGTNIYSWIRGYAKCNPKTGQLIYEILPSRQAVKCFYEFLGYCLYRGYPIHKAFMFTGYGSNGKSTLLNLIRMFLGAINTCSISLQSLCEDRFSRAELYGKMLNYFADLKDIALTETGEFKALTGSDQISAEMKFKQKHVTFTNTTKFALAVTKYLKTRAMIPMLFGEDG